MIAALYSKTGGKNGKHEIHPIFVRSHWQILLFRSSNICTHVNSVVSPRQHLAFKQTSLLVKILFLRLLSHPQKTFTSGCKHITGSSCNIMALPLSVRSLSHYKRLTSCTLSNSPNLVLRSPSPLNILQSISHTCSIPSSLECSRFPTGFPVALKLIKKIQVPNASRVCLHMRTSLKKQCDCSIRVDKMGFRKMRKPEKIM